MNNITITHELCAEDRARIDRLTDALVALAAAKPEAAEEASEVKPQDDIQKKLADTIEKAKQATPTEPAKKHQDEPKATDDHPTLDPLPATPTAAEGASEAAVETVTVADLQHLVITLCRAKKQGAILDIIKGYGAKTIAEVPKDKIAEVYAKLKQLEG
jgi:hypothetical protein